MPITPPTAAAKPSPVILDWLNDDRKFWSVAAVILGIFAICKGLRMPGEWALTQAQLDYSHGLIKRGLLGAVYHALHLQHRRPLSAAFFVELAALFVALVVFTRRSGIIERFGSAAVVAVFASSYAVTFLVHTVGYTDIPLATISIGALLIRPPRLRFFVCLPIVVLAMLIHESFMLLFLPAILFSFQLDRLFARDRLESRAILRYMCLLGSVAILLAVALSLHRNLTDSQIAAWRSEVISRTDFTVRDDFFSVLNRSLLENIHITVHEVRSNRVVWIQFLGSALALLPLALLAWHCMRRMFEAIGQQYGARSERTIRTSAVIAGLTPLAMYALGWDLARWNVIFILGVYLILLLLSRQLEGTSLRLQPFERNAIILVIAVNMVSGQGLFDAEQPLPFPFIPVDKVTQQAKVAAPVIRNH